MSTAEQCGRKAAREGALYRNAAAILDRMAYIGMCALTAEERCETMLLEQRKAELAELARLFVKQEKKERSRTASETPTP